MSNENISVIILGHIINLYNCQHALLSNGLSIADTDASASFTTIHTTKALETLMVFILYLNKHLCPFIKLLRMRGEQTSQSTVK
jgi:hypothetical protein